MTLAFCAVAQTDTGHALPNETYQEMWERGAYREALDLLEGRINERRESFVPSQWSEDYARLLFEVGRVDEAIQALERIESRRWELPLSILLLEMYKYRGNLDEYAAQLERLNRRAEWAIRAADEQTWLALARLAEHNREHPNEILGTRLKILMDRRPRFTDGFVMAGDLAYRHRAYDMSANYFARALDIDPHNQMALAGLAECYDQSGDPRVIETLERLRSINPAHPRLLAMEAEKLLDLGNAREAREIIDARLEVNPNDLHFLSLKAAVHFLDDDAEALERVQYTVLSFNPHWSGVFRLPGRVAARHYRFAEAAALQRKAIETDAEDHEARSQLAFNLLRLGEDDEGREQLEEAYLADPFNVHTVNLLKVMDSMDKFQTIDDGVFRIQLPEHEARILGDGMLAMLHEALALYEDKYRVTVARPVVIQMFDVHDEFMVRSVGLPGNRGHLGICFGRVVTMDSPRARRPNSMNWHSVLWHEFVHVITLQKTNNRMPRWLSEGISVYEETAKAPAWGQRLEPGFKAFVEEEGWPGSGDLERYFTQPQSSFHLIYGYFLAGEFIAAYLDAYGIDALVDALERIGEGRAAVPALARAAGVDVDAVDEVFAAHLAERCAPLNNLPALPRMDEEPENEQPRAWASLPSPFTDKLREGSAALAAGDFETAEAAFREADELFPEFEGPQAPLRQLARMYREQGRMDAYADALETIVTRDATAWPALEALLQHYLDVKAWDDVVRVAGLAFGINPFDISTQRSYLAGLQGQEAAMEAADVLQRLIVLDRQRQTEYRLERARMLAKAGEMGPARRETVELLESMPHFWDAQQLLLQLASEGEHAATP